MHTVVVGGFLITYFESIGAGIALYFRNRILERGEIGHVPGFLFFCCTFLEFKAYGVEDFWCGSCGVIRNDRSEEHTSELQSLMRISYAVFCLKKKKQIK